MEVWNLGYGDERGEEMNGELWCGNELRRGGEEQESKGEERTEKGGAYLFVTNLSSVLYQL